MPRSSQNKLWETANNLLGYGGMALVIWGALDAILLTRLTSGLTFVLIGVIAMVSGAVGEYKRSAEVRAEVQGYIMDKAVSSATGGMNMEDMAENMMKNLGPEDEKNGS